MDRVAVVTGASRGIGAATAAELARRGWQVALLGRDATALKAVTAAIGEERAAWFVADVTDQESMESAAVAVADRFGGVDAVVANAGVYRPGTIRSLTAAAVSQVVDTNVVGAYRTVQVFLPALIRSRGYVLLMSSIASSVGMGGQSSYAASKAAVEMLARTLRMEVAHLGIGVGSVHPWFAETDLLRESEAVMPSFAGVRRRLAPLARIPGPLGLVGRTLTAQECGVAVADMVGDRARKRHVPRSAGLVASMRPVLDTGPADRAQRVLLGWLMRRVDAETEQALGTALPAPDGRRSARETP